MTRAGDSGGPRRRPAVHGFLQGQSDRRAYGTASLRGRSRRPPPLRHGGGACSALHRVHPLRRRVQVCVTVAGRWSLVAGCWSLVAGRWSLVTGHWSLVIVTRGTWHTPGGDAP
eukprot:1000079-Pyramimonas_sp.AAC.1